jgi:hypothetical protein
MRDTSETEEDLRTTSDAVVLDADRLLALEEAKRDLEPEDPARIRISAELAELGRRLEEATAAQLELVIQARDEAATSPGSPEPPIEG